ncbi:MAG: hypothetical protein HY741_08600 [Chloroflexi bacterium]|nr:hypothetical protein [Chloroflexota bacterium]
MSAKQNRKRWIMVGVLGFLALAMGVGLFGLVSFGVNFFRPIPETPAALASAVPISPQNLDQLEPLYQFTVTDPVHTLVWSPDNRLLAVETEKWPAIPIGEPLRAVSLHLWDIVNGNGRALYSATGLGPTQTSSVAFSADGQILAFQAHSTIQLWDVPQNRELRTFTDVDNLDASAAAGNPTPDFPEIPGALFTFLSPDRKIVAASYSGCPYPNSPKLKLFDATSGKELRELEGCANVAFSHNSKMIASMDWSKRVEYEAPLLLSDVESGQVLQRLEGNVYGRPIAFSPGDKLVASHSFAASASYVWDVSSGQRLTLERIPV